MSFLHFLTARPTSHSNPRLFTCYHHDGVPTQAVVETWYQQQQQYHKPLGSSSFSTSDNQKTSSLYY